MSSLPPSRHVLWFGTAARYCYYPFGTFSLVSPWVTASVVTLQLSHDDVSGFWFVSRSVLLKWGASGAFFNYWLCEISCEE